MASPKRYCAPVAALWPLAAVGGPGPDLFDVGHGVLGVDVEDFEADPGVDLVVAAGLYNVYREQVRRAAERSRLKDNA